MNNKARWIWYYGEYEIFHSLLLHSRRQEFGADYPPPWTLSNVFPVMTFENKYTVNNPTMFRVYVNGSGYVLIDGERYPTETEICCPPGTHTVTVKVINPHGLPAAFVSGEKIHSDKTWTAYYACGTEKPVGCTPGYFSEKDNVQRFPFSYRRMKPVSQEKTEDGYLFDFGRELFGFLNITVKTPCSVYYGESREEAVSCKNADMHRNALVFENLETAGKNRLKQRAFRFIHIISENRPTEIFAEYEYLPIKDTGSFDCEDPEIKKIYDMCAYTFHLNSREFYLDGIKRDRWVWSGDAYQSFMINRYLYADPEITKRTILALLGKPPYVQHINTINDYSLYLIISVYDYWFDTADTDFVKNIYDRLYSLYGFCVSRLDENGFVCEKPGDWIFVDWAELDKEGPMCAEQILLWKATECIKELASVTGNECSCAPDTDGLKKKIFRYYYRKDLGGFIDGYVSGKNRISRHQNVFALLYDFTDPEESALIMEKVLKNGSVPKITTPYFEFYELLAMCKYGNVKYAADMLKSYWGEMLSLGATSVWEEFDSEKDGSEHYAMYGNSFGKSLCHAWGSGPICILGKYIAGVTFTSPGGKTFEVKPDTETYKSFRATVPAPKGKISVNYSEGKISVFSDCSGGTLVFGGEKYKIEKGKTLSL